MLGSFAYIFVQINVLKASFHEDTMNFQHFPGEKFTDFSKESFLTRMSHIKAKVKERNYFAQKITDCGLVTALAAPNAVCFTNAVFSTEVLVFCGTLITLLHFRTLFLKYSLTSFRLI